jgi:acetamidase/formamidase
VGQGPWGGNIDTRDIAAGHKIHLNSSHAGGLLFLGDVHASQGDSELTGIADETAADVTIRCEVLKGITTPGVCRIEKPDSIVQVDSARNSGSMEKALENCFVNLISSLVKINVYQFTTGFFTCGVEFPKQYLQ